MLSEDNWYVFVADAQRGPFTRQQVEQLYRAGKLSPTDDVWSEGMSGWSKASDVFQPPRPVPPPRPASPRQNLVPAQTSGDVADHGAGTRVVKLHGYVAELHTRIGTIISVQIISDTSIVGGGYNSGGYVTNGTGYVGGGSSYVSGSTTHRFRAFMRFENGDEDSIDFDDAFPVREGNRLLLRRMKYGDEYVASLIRNLDSGKESTYEKLLVRYDNPDTFWSWGAAALGAGTVLGAFAVLVAIRGLPPTNEYIPVIAVFALVSAFVFLLARKIFRVIFPSKRAAQIESQAGEFLAKALEEFRD